MRRVVITGLGALTPLGKTVDEYFRNLVEAKNGIRFIDRFDTTNLKTRIAGLLPDDFDPLDRLERKEAGVMLSKMDPFLIYSLYATVEAVEDSGILGKANPERVGVIIASGIGGIQTLVRETIMYEQKGRVSPYLVPMMIPDMASGLVSMKYGFMGPNFTTISACSSAANAIGEAFRLIQHGDAEVIIAGGAEAPVIPVAISGFNAARALSTRNEPDKASRPFDRDRDGFVMGEGAGILVLEELEHALNRGARIYAEIVGYGISADAYHITAPREDGLGAAMAMERALRDAGIQPEEVDYINAHGTSTQLNDVMETRAIKKVFGEHAYRIPISSTKSMIGHLLGAAGGAESVATVKTIVEGIIHPTRNLDNPDPECDLDYVPWKARRKDVRVALSNSFGFGGHNVTLVYKKFEG